MAPTDRLRPAPTTVVLALAGLVLAGLPGPAAAVVAPGGPPPATVACADPAAAGRVSTTARGGRGPDTRPVTVREQRQITRRTERILARPTIAPRRAGGRPPIPVHVHVMANDRGRGNVTGAAIRAQVAVLNRTYAGKESGAAAATGFRFRLRGIDRYSNDAWHRDRRSRAYRTRTRQGGARALNLWLVDLPYLGIATFPWDYAARPRVDGVRLDHEALPGGGLQGYDLGKTATHEVGHWLGLFHTFQGGCTERNDDVDDTPAQATFSTGCPEGADTCDLPGADPVHNYMDYSEDACYSEFTAGQGRRMRAMFAAHRR